MPNYDFECTKGHVFEAFVSLDEMRKGIKCTYSKCKRKALRVVLSPRASRMARNFAPTLTFVDNNGHVIMPGRNNIDHLPKKYLKQLAKQGFKPRELTNFREYEQFQKEQRIVAKDERDKRLAYQQEVRDKLINEGIEALKRGGDIEVPDILPDGSYGTRIIHAPRLEDMQPAMRKFAEYAIDKARESSIHSSDPSPYIDAFEHDSRTYRDRDTDWKRKG